MGLASGYQAAVQGNMADIDQQRVDTYSRHMAVENAIEQFRLQYAQDAFSREAAARAVLGQAVDSMHTQLSGRPAGSLAYRSALLPGYGYGLAIPADTSPLYAPHNFDPIDSGAAFASGFAQSWPSTLPAQADPELTRRHAAVQRALAEVELALRGPWRWD